MSIEQEPVFFLSVRIAIDVAKHGLSEVAMPWESLRHLKQVAHCALLH